MCVWIGLFPETSEWLPVPLGKFPNLSMVYKIFQDVDSAYLHSYNLLTCLLLQLNSLSMVVSQICYAELLLAVQPQAKMYSFNKYLIVTSFLSYARPCSRQQNPILKDLLI